MSSAQKIRVLIADDHAILRAGLRMLISAQPDMMVVGEAEDGAQAIRIARETSPDVAVLDITMPETGGLHAIAELQKNQTPLRVLLLTMHDEPAYLRTALAAGASGYVLKKSVDADLLSAIRAVHKGRTYVDSELANDLIHELRPDYAQARTDSPEANMLSERETQVLKLVAEGFSSREIAEQILISTKTVETYRRRFAEKLGLESRADIVRYALDSGLLSPERFTSPQKPAHKPARRG
jgi:two-component system, NarL family, response regulator NreC